MAKRKIIDNKKLIQMIQGGAVQQDILEKFGFKNSSQLKVAYANALMESGQAPVIKSGRGSGKATAVNKQIVVNKRGSLVIPKDLIEAYGFKEGDTFEARASKVGLSLRKV